VPLPSFVAVAGKNAIKKRYQRRKYSFPRKTKDANPDLGGGFRFKYETKNQPVHAEFDPTGYVSGVP
jgi:hypothetical protein